MNNYIYEMDVTMLRISYIMPPGWYCSYIETILKNNIPFDRSNLTVEYRAYCRHTSWNEENFTKMLEIFRGDSYQEVTENARKWAIAYKQSAVEKSPDDGTDSVIRT